MYLFSSLSGLLLWTGTHYFNNTEAKFCHSPVDMDQSIVPPELNQTKLRPFWK